MVVLWLLFVSSVVVLPATALLALRWALRSGEFKDLSRTALSIFDDDEPVGRQTDFFPGLTPNTAPLDSRNHPTHAAALPPPTS